MYGTCFFGEFCEAPQCFQPKGNRRLQQKGAPHRFVDSLNDGFLVVIIGNATGGRNPRKERNISVYYNWRIVCLPVSFALLNLEDDGFRNSILLN